MNPGLSFLNFGIHLHEFFQSFSSNAAAVNYLPSQPENNSVSYFYLMTYYDGGRSD